jgi:hypothetical protein
LVAIDFTLTVRTFDEPGVPSGLAPMTGKGAGRAKSCTLLVLLLCATRAGALCWSCPPGPQFTAADKAAQLQRGATVLPAIAACVASNVSTCARPSRLATTAPARPARLPAELAGLQRPATNPLTLDLRGVTFRFTTAWGPVPGAPRASYLHVYNCTNLVLEACGRLGPPPAPSRGASCRSTPLCDMCWPSAQAAPLWPSPTPPTLGSGSSPLAPRASAWRRCPLSAPGLSVQSAPLVNSLDKLGGAEL